MSVPLALTMFHWMLARNQCDRRKCWHTMRYRKTVLTGNTRPTSPFLHSLHAVLSQLFSIPFPTCLGTSGTVNDKAKFEKNCYNYYSISNKTDHRFHHLIFTGSDNFGDHSALRDNREISIVNWLEQSQFCCLPLSLIIRRPMSFESRVPRNDRGGRMRIRLFATRQSASLPSARIYDLLS